MNQKAVRPRTAPQRAAAVTSDAPVMPTSDWAPRRTGGVVIPTTFWRSTNFRKASIAPPAKERWGKSARGSHKNHGGGVTAIAERARREVGPKLLVGTECARPLARPAAMHSQAAAGQWNTSKRGRLLQIRQSNDTYEYTKVGIVKVAPA